MATGGEQMATGNVEEDFATGEATMRALYQAWLDGWNRRDAEAYAALFTEDGGVIGFDGSPMNGRAEIEAQLRQIFADHQTAAYVGKVRETRLLSPTVAMLRAVAGMVPPGKREINPAVNAMQTLVGVRDESGWRIALAQVTPALFHGRPELSAALTEELSQLL
jgi:uncharacterized protein (TIGR02246 family)